jgi:AmmeMemoRadiSam system protein A
MPNETLTQEDRSTLLKLARQAITDAVKANPLHPPELKNYSEMLQREGASFVTLTIQGDLRGCIGALEPYQPLVVDVWEHAIAAAMEDYRFYPLSEPELGQVNIEISHLTVPQKLEYTGPDDLIVKLRPDKDGVILREGRNRATFLPQVWEKIPDARSFLSQLCVKMGAPSNYWSTHHLDVLIYQVEEFHEE